MQRVWPVLEQVINSVIEQWWIKWDADQHASASLKVERVFNFIYGIASYKMIIMIELYDPVQLHMLTARKHEQNLLKLHLAEVANPY